MKLITTEKELCEYCYKAHLRNNNPCDTCLAFKLCETFTANMVVSPKNFVSDITKKYNKPSGDNQRVYFYFIFILFSLAS